MSQSKLAAVGAFVAGGILLFAVGLFLIGDRRLLFAEQFELDAQFGRVTGVQVGTKVRTAGLDAGEVLELQLPSRPSERFVVRMRVREDLRPLVRTDSIATIQTDGLVGSAFIQISRGTDEAAMVPPGGQIEGHDPIEFVDLIEDGRTMFRTISTEMVDLKDDVSATFAALTDTTRAANVVLGEAGDELTKVAQAGVRVADEFRGVLADTRQTIDRVQAGEGTIGRLVTDDSLYRRAEGLAAEAEQSVRNVREITDQARITLDGFTAEGGTGAAVMTDLRLTLAESQEVMSDLAETTEAFKRSWLVSSFFRDRGFYDLDSITVDEYRAGTIENDERAPLRVWIEADVLFDRDGRGAERLTDEGRRRIDSAMADLLRFPRESPLVVEGYVEASAAIPLFEAEDRALLVHEYLVDKFRRRVTLTGTMPLGTDAVGSPSGDGTWSGVALAMFVEKEKLE